MSFVSSINSHLNNKSSYVRIFSIRFISLSIITIWVFGFIQPMLGIIDNAVINYFLKRAYSLVCHQESYKLITHAGAEMLVCSRCTGIYIGSLLAGLTTLLFAIPQIKTRILLFASIPIAADVLLNIIEYYDYSRLIAFSTGMILGITLYLFLMNEIENLFSNS